MGRRSQRIRGLKVVGCLAIHGDDAHVLLEALGDGWKGEAKPRRSHAQQRAHPVGA